MGDSRRQLVYRLAEFERQSESAASAGNGGPVRSVCPRSMERVSSQHGQRVAAIVQRKRHRLAEPLGLEHGDDHLGGGAGFMDVRHRMPNRGRSFLDRYAR